MPKSMINLIFFFVAVGFWHGASWSFVFWGLFHGLFLILERIGLGQLLDRSFMPIRHAYTLLVVLIAWVFFRVEDFSDALNYVSILFGNERSTTIYIEEYINNYTLIALVLGVLFSTNVKKGIHFLEAKTGMSKLPIYLEFRSLVFLVFLAIVFYFSVTEIASDTYNPFIYLRF